MFEDEMNRMKLDLAEPYEIKEDVINCSESFINQPFTEISDNSI